jgi:hypothetical protein
MFISNKFQLILTYNKSYFYQNDSWDNLFHKNKCVLTSKGDNSAEKLHNPTSDFSICPWSGISEVRTADSYGVSEFMSVWSFSGVCVAQSSVFFVFVIFCQPAKELGAIALPTLKSWGWQN